MMVPPARTEPALQIEELHVSIRAHEGRDVEVLSGVNLAVMPGEALGLVGESGSGKTLTGLAAMGLLPSTAKVRGGRILVKGTDLLTLKQDQVRKLRGSAISMILQDPVTSLDPSFTIGAQLAERITLRSGARGAEVVEESLRLLQLVRISSPQKRLDQYPHQLSGGMLQRICSAIALAGQPEIFIADEPTTALDVTTQAQYLRLLHDLQATTGFALVLVSHDLSIIRKMCTRIAVMYAGQIVETGPTESITRAPAHPYTAALFAALPQVGVPRRLEAIPGQSPDPARYPAGCRFAPRCMFARDECGTKKPDLSARESDHLARCFGTEADGWIDRLDRRDIGVGQR